MPQDGTQPQTVPVLPAGVTVISATAGQTLTVEVDVNAMTTPYTVIFAERTLIYGLTDRREQADLVRGSHRLTWSFSHVVKTWKHELKVRVDSGPWQVLDSKAEANKDAPYSIGWAVVVVA